MENHHARSFVLGILQNLVDSFAQPKPSVGPDIAALRLGNLFRVDSSIVINLRHALQDGGQDAAAVMGLRRYFTT